MNAEQRFNKIERRLDQLEQDRDSMIENEKILLKLARLHRLSLQELKAQTELDMGDIRERLDTLERTMATKEDIAELKATQEIHGELLKEILQRLPPRQ